MINGAPLHSNPKLTTLIFNLLVWKKRFTAKMIAERANELHFMGDGVAITPTNVRTVWKHYGNKREFMRAMRKVLRSRRIEFRQ
jgi:hypothetical protein